MLTWKSCETVSSELLTHREVHKHTHTMKHYPDTHITTTMWNVMTPYCVGTLKEKTLRLEIHCRKLKQLYLTLSMALLFSVLFFHFFYYSIYEPFANCSLCKGLLITPPSTWDARMSSLFSSSEPCAANRGAWRCAAVVSSRTRQPLPVFRVAVQI